MLCCGTIPKDLCEKFDCKVEESDNGLTINLTSDDPKKAYALKQLFKASKELCGDACCC
ncbi:MAG: hypothetical protein ACE5FH_12410 [Candidatus Zixiibacteriota bacterium]